MRGAGVLVNVLTVLAGTGVGLLFGRLIAERFREIAMRAIGLATFAIGIQMAVKTDDPLILVGSLVIGALIGEAIGIERALERFGHRLQLMAHRVPGLAPGEPGQPGSSGHTVVEGFVAASLLFCVGTMTVLGSIQDGLGSPDLLYLKATLDGVASVALASALGVGVGFSVIPIVLIQGGIALAAGTLEPVLTKDILLAIEAAGGTLILAIGLDLMAIKRLPVGNMLPAVLVAAVLQALFG